MTPYILILAVATVLALASDAYNRQGNLPQNKSSQNTATAQTIKKFNIFDFFILSILVSFMGLRTNVGTDFSNYEYLYRQVDTNHWAWSIETIPQEATYTILSLLVKSITTSPQAIFIASAILIVVPMMWVLRHRSEIYALSMFLYISMGYYLSPFNGMRQGISVSLLVLGDYLYGKNKVAGVLILILACFFHSSAIIAIALYLLAKILKPNAVLLLVIVALAFVVLFIPNLGELVGTVASFFNERYLDYLNPSEAGVGRYLAISLKLALCVYILILAKEKRFNQHYLVLFIMSIFFTIMSTEYTYFARFDAYMSVFTLLLLPQLIAQSRQKIVHISILGTVMFCYMILYLLNYGDLLPYSWTTP